MRDLRSRDPLPPIIRMPLADRTDEGGLCTSKSANQCVAAQNTPRAVYISNEPGFGRLKHIVAVTQGSESLICVENEAEEMTAFSISSLNFRNGFRHRRDVLRWHKN